MTQLYYSPSSKGFYSSELHGDGMPTDCIEVAEEKYAELLEGEGIGKEIYLNENQQLVLSDRLIAEPTKEDNILRLLHVVQLHMDTEASKQGFLSLQDAISYVDEESVPEFQDKAKKLRAWRSLVWKAYQTAILSDPLSSTEDLLSLLPKP